MKKWLAVILGCMMMLSFACAQENVRITEVVTQIGANAVRYPQLSGMADETVQSLKMEAAKMMDSMRNI